MSVLVLVGASATAVHQLTHTGARRDWTPALTGYAVAAAMGTLTFVSLRKANQFQLTAV
jgi:hypothetical protein